MKNDIPIPHLARALAEEIRNSGLLVQPEYLSTEQAAIFLGSSVSKLEKLRRTCDGPRHSKIGALVRYARKDLVAYMDANAAGSVA